MELRELMTIKYLVSMGVGKAEGRGGGGGGESGVGQPLFLGAIFLHFLYKVLGMRSVQNEL